MCKVHHGTVERLINKSGDHSQAIHEECAVDLELTAIQSDERHGTVEEKKQHYWEATTIDPKSKFLLSLRLGKRTNELIRELLEDTVKGLRNLKILSYLQMANMVMQPISLKSLG